MKCRFPQGNLMKFRWLPLLFLTLFVATHAQAEDKPNVLWIYLEDVSGWFSCYGDKVIETPNIDALAADGVRFDRFYVSAGVCSAMRSGTIVGMMQTSVGAHNHRSCRATFRGKSMGEYDKNVLPESVKPVPQIFKEAGFYTFNEGTGKDDFNFEWDSKELYDRAAGPEFKGAKDGTDWSGRAEGQPFFGQIQLMGGKYKKLKPVTDRAKVPVPPYYPDVPEVRESIAYHYDCLLKVDAEVGKIVAGLKRDGLYENTYIMMFSDHGYGLHRHKQMVYDGGIHMPLTVSGPNIAGKAVRDDLVSSIDLAPASLALVGLPIPKSMEGHNFMAHGFTPRDYVISARDRCDFTIEKIRAVVTPKFKYLKNYTDDRPFMQPTYKDGWGVTKKFRSMMAAGEMNETQMLFFRMDGKEPEEFYDLANDPNEINNLAKDPKYAADIEAHRKILADWIAETGDQGQAIESDLGLLSALKRWGDSCVNPEYDKVRHLLKETKEAEPKKKKKKKQ